MGFRRLLAKEGGSPRVLVAGHLLRAEGFVEGWADVEKGEVRATGRGPPPRTPHARGVVVPAPVNAHTHVGDAALRGRLDPARGLDRLVRFPDGEKHRLLAATAESVLLEGAARALAEHAASGGARVVDFREGGLAGVRLLRDAARRAGAEAAALGRLLPGEDLGALVAAADGVGIPAVDNLPPGEAARWGRAARAAGKTVGVHAAEGAPEPIDAVLDCAPHHVVHLVHAARADLERLADARVAAVLCPRSNAALVRRLPDARAMLDAGLVVALGTDNASFQTPSVFEEASFLAARGGVAAIDVLRMAFLHGGVVVAGGAPHPGVVEGARGPFLVLAEAGDPAATALAASPSIVARI